MFRFFEYMLLFVLCAYSLVGMENEAITRSAKIVQDKGKLLREKADETLEYVREIRARHTSGNKFSHYTDFCDLNERIEAWKKVLLAECGYITRLQEGNWRFCGAGFDDYRVCFYQHRNIQASLSILQRENSDDEINEALDYLEKELIKVVNDSMIAAKEANKCAAHWIDAWLRNNGHSSVRSMVQVYRTKDNTEQIDDFIQCWYSGEFWKQPSFNIKNKLECIMFILLSERANFAATFGGCDGIVSYSKGKAYCFAPDYTEGLSYILQKHFSEDELILSFLDKRLTPKNRLTIFRLIYPIDEVY